MFTIFLALPIELRWRIYELALPERIIVIQLKRQGRNAEIGTGQTTSNRKLSFHHPVKSLRETSSLCPMAFRCKHFSNIHSPTLGQQDPCSSRLLIGIYIDI